MKHFYLKIYHLGPASRTVSINSAPAELLGIIKFSPKACCSHEAYLHIALEIFYRWLPNAGVHLFIWLH